MRCRTASVDSFEELVSVTGELYLALELGTKAVILADSCLEMLTVRRDVDVQSVGFRGVYSILGFHMLISSVAVTRTEIKLI